MMIFDDMCYPREAGIDLQGKEPGFHPADNKELLKLNFFCLFVLIKSVL